MAGKKKKSKKSKRKYKVANFEQNQETNDDSIFDDDNNERFDDLTDKEEQFLIENAKKAEPSAYDRPIKFYNSEDEFPKNSMKAVITSVHRRFFCCLSEGSDYICYLPGQLLIRERIYKHPVAVGDIVSIVSVSNLSDKKVCTLDGILERKSVLSRTANFRSEQEQIIAANIDQMLIIASTTSPRLNMHLIDRMIVTAERSKIESIICINKIDLDDAEVNVAEVASLYRNLGYRVILSSVITNDGILEIKEVLKNKVSVLTGPSGAGKSSLLNKIQKDFALKVSEVSEKTNKGRHTTSFAVMLKLDFGGFVIDTPGIRSFGLFNLTKPELIEYFKEMHIYLGKCKYNNCSHTGIEKDCALIEAVQSGIVDKRRYESFVAIYNSLDD